MSDDTVSNDVLVELRKIKVKDLREAYVLVQVADEIQRLRQEIEDLEEEIAYASWQRR